MRVGVPASLYPCVNLYPDTPTLVYLCTLVTSYHDHVTTPHHDTVTPSHPTTMKPPHVCTLTMAYHVDVTTS
jgi:hypothetical protein